MAHKNNSESRERYMGIVNSFTRPRSSAREWVGVFLCDNHKDQDLVER
jgi:hypothetical protein